MDPLTEIEDDEVADLPAHRVQTQDAHGYRFWFGPGANSPLARRQLAPAGAPSAGLRARGLEQRQVAGRLLVLRQSLTPGTEMGRPDAQHESLDGSTAAEARLTGPLVDVEVVLHLAVALGRGVVIDGRATPLDALREHRAQVGIEGTLVGRAQAGGAPERVELREPERLVGVDVADPGEERLVDEQRLESGTPTPDELPEDRQRE